MMDGSLWRREWAGRLGVAPDAGWREWLWRLFVRPTVPGRPDRVDALLCSLWSVVWPVVWPALARLAAGVRAGSLRTAEQVGRAGRWIGAVAGRGRIAGLALLRLAGERVGRACRPWLMRWLMLWLLRWRRVAAAVDLRPAGAALEGWAGHRWLASPLLRWSLILLGALAYVLAISTPMDLRAQALFFVALLAAALLLRQVPGTLAKLVLIGLALLATGRYGWWRVTQSMAFESGWEAALGWGLLAAEVYAWAIMLLGFVQNAWPLQRRPVALTLPREQWPVVDVFIPTYNEPLSVLRPTVLAARDLDWPADKLRVFVLDDGRRDEVRAFAAEAGVQYMTRPDNSHAKAGNLNHALACTGGEFVAIFDCDHLPVRSFLRQTMGWMLNEPRCAMVQTPHHFFSPDPFERNLGTFRRVPNEGKLFYGLVQDGNDFWDATFFCGSCAVLRREPLMAVGGIAVETVTEDAHTALKLHRHGWHTAYLNETLAAGLATENLAGHVAQRMRWARGMAQIFRIDNPLLGRGLNLMQRLCYANAMLHFFYGLPRLVFLTAPLAYLFFDLHIIHAPVEVIAIYLLPHLVLPQIANTQIQGPHRHAFWAEVYESVLAWYVTLPTTVALLSPKHGQFNVTAKGGLVENTHFDWTISRPYFYLVLLNALAFAAGVRLLAGAGADEQGTVAINMAWTVYNMLLLGAAIGVAREQRQVRAAHRVEGQLEVRLAWPDGGMFACRTQDYSFSGLGVGLPAALLAQLDLQRGERLQVLMREEAAPDGRPGREHAFDAEVSGVRDNALGLAFLPQSLDQQAALIRCSFTRADAWSAWHTEVEDAPRRALTGLAEVVVHGLRGYRGAAAARAAAIGQGLCAWTAAARGLLQRVADRRTRAV